MSYDNTNKTNKHVRRIPNIKEILQTLFCIFVVVSITYWIESTCLNTLLSICIPWMYYRIAAIIIIPALFFLPNRYFKIEPEIEYEGCVVDQTEWKLSKTASWDNYVKIKIDDSNTSFWCCMGKESWPIGTKCIISARKGIFGMRYVENVRFLIE